ncbi:MAG TPA: arginine--tRNA ligase [Solirubrobacterales bacterium]|jgi:arginyl-tRNA synthetase|nr:arginine--tRNA ligase [Solirubrobacterales bacterium]
MSTNLFDHFDEIAAHEEAGVYWTPRAPFTPHERFDLRLIPRVEAWQRSSESRKALELIEGDPLVDTVETDGEEVWLRLDSDWIERRGAAIEAGEDEGSNSDIAAGERYALNFWDANSTKALHVGHLRNLALGNALGSALEQAGGEVERRSLICDVGRSMGEAMAGVVKSGRHTPESGEKSDHFVGYCYADYVKAGRAGGISDRAEDSVARESSLHEDEADELINSVLAGDVEALELWSKTRAWVISGQRKTLSRLGVAFDKVFFESDFLPEVDELTAAGLEQGRLQKRHDGVVVYETGREELEEMPMLRSDGLATQHMRALAYWMTAPELDGTTSIQVCGSEWVSHVTCRRQLMDEFATAGTGEGAVHPRHDIFYGMVARQKRALTSSDEKALLIDDLVEWIDEQMQADPERAEVRRAYSSSDRVPSQVALGYYLMHPTAKRVDFEPEKMLLESQSLGWDLALARSRPLLNGNGNGAAAANGHDLAQDAEYRFAVVQAEMYRRFLQTAVNKLDVSSLSHYMSHLIRWHLERDRGPHVERVVQAVLDQGSRGLGFEAAR